MKTWIPRLLQDDGMIPMCEAPSYAKMCTQYVALADVEQALAEKDLEIDCLSEQVNVLNKECLKYEKSYQHIMAEKDREIQQIREHEFQNGYREGKASMMAQAVQFAQYIKDKFTYDDDPRFVEAEAFLKEHS